MAYLGNTPPQHTVLRLEARKSFSLGILVSDPHGRPVDLTDCTLTIVAQDPPFDAETQENLLADDAEATLEDPTYGYARLHLQAATLDLAAKEYPFAIVLTTAEGYTSVVVKGTMEVRENTEFDSVFTSYDSVNPTETLSILLREANTLRVYVGGQLPPGMNYIRDDTLAVLEAFDPDSVAMVPPGGVVGYLLTKTGAGDYAMAWRPPGQGTDALDATSQPKGRVPVAQGDGTWTWDAAGIDAEGVTPGWAPLANGDGTWDWAQIQLTQPDWNAPAGSSASILNQPELGTAAMKNEEEFIAAGTLVSEMPGIHFVATVPSTGEDGHLYFVYQA